MTLIWTPQAREEFLRILSYIAHDSIERAFTYGQKIERKVSALKRFPKIGRHVPEFAEEAPDLREFLIDDYRLVYKIQIHAVHIVTIFHGRRRFPPIDSDTQETEIG